MPVESAAKIIQYHSLITSTLVATGPYLPTCPSIAALPCVIVGLLVLKSTHRAESSQTSIKPSEAKSIDHYPTAAAYARGHLHWFAPKGPLVIACALQQACKPPGLLQRPPPIGPFRPHVPPCPV